MRILGGPTWWLGVLVAGAAWSAEPCVSSSEVSARQEKAAQANAAALKQAMKAAKLTLLTLPFQNVTVGHGQANFDALTKPSPPPSAPGPQVFIEGDTHWSGNASPQETWQFVTDAKGVVHRLMLEPRVTTETVRVCEAQCPGCGPVGSGCPACGVTTRRRYGPLPPKTVVGEPVSLAYPVRDVVAVSATPCPEPFCPQPP